jgi:hypothetical protein
MIVVSCACVRDDIRTFVVNTTVGFVAIASVPLVQFRIFETPAAFLLQRQVKESLGLVGTLLVEHLQMSLGDVRV